MSCCTMLRKWMPIGGDGSFCSVAFNNLFDVGAVEERIFADNRQYSRLFRHRTTSHV